MKTVYKILIPVIAIPIIAISVIPWILGPLVKSTISKVSNQTITFEYSESHTNIFTRVISFDSVTFSFDNMAYDSASEIKLKRLTFKSFAIDEISLTDLVLRNELNVRKLIMDSPVLWLNKDSTEVKNDLTNQQFLSNILKRRKQKKQEDFLFHIDEFEIKKGGFVFTDKNNRKISIEGLNLLVTDLQRDNFKATDGNDNNLFDFKARLELTGVEQISENIYKSRIENFIIDTKQKNVILKGINIIPLKKPDSTNPVLYTVKTNLLDIEGIELKDILQQTEFRIKKVKVGHIDFTESKFYTPKSSKKTGTPRTDTFNIFSFFREYNVGSVSFDAITFQSVNAENDTSKLIKTGKTSINNIKVDSATLKSINNNYLIHHTSISTQSVYIRLSEPDIKLMLDSLIYSATDTTTYLRNLSANLTCLSTVSDSVPKCKIKIGSAALRNLTPEVLFTGDDKAISVQISDWTANISNPSKVKFPEKSNTSFKLSEKLYFNIVELKNGNVRIIEADSTVFNINKFDLSTTGLTLFIDRKKYQKIFNYKEITTGFDKLGFYPGQDFSLDINNCRLNNYNLNIAHIDFSNNKTDNTNISFNEFAISGFDVRKLINRKEFIAKNVTFGKPDIIHTVNKPSVRQKNDSLNFKILRRKIAKGIEKSLNKLKINNLTFSNGDININNTNNKTTFKSSFGLQIGDIKFDKYDKRYSDEISIGDILLKLNNSSLRLKDISMKYDSVIIDTKADKISFINSFLLSLQDKRATGEKKNELHAFIPRIDISCPDFNAYLYHPMSFSSMVIEKPTFNLLIHNKKKKNKKQKPLTADIPFSYFKDYIKLNNAKINITVESEKDTMRVKVSDISATWYENVPKPAAGISFSAHEQMHKAEVAIAGLTLSNSKTDISIDEVKHKVNGTEIRIKGFKQSSYKLNKKGKELNNRVAIPEILIEHPVLHKRMGKLANIDFQKVITDDADIDLYQLQEKSTPSKHFNFKDTTLRPVFNYLGHFTIEYTKIGNLHFQYFPKEKNKKPVDITRMSIIIKKMRIDSSVFTTHKSIINDMDITFFKREMVTKNGMYLIKSNNVTYSYKNNRLILDSVYLIPRYGRKEFFKKAVYQTDRISLKGKNIIIDGIDFESILTDRIYHISRVSLNGFEMIDHRDKRYERKPGEIKSMPQTALKNLPFKIAIDSLYVNNSYMLYGEYVDKSQKSGEAYFTDFNLTVSNITNVNKSITRNPRMDVIMSTKLMDDARLTLNVGFILNDPLDYFEYSGHLNYFDITKMNPMVENLLGLTIKSGKGTLDINEIKGNNDVATGELFFKYKNFKLGLYNRNKAKEVTGILSPIVSFVVNDIKLRSNNPKSLGKPRIGEVYFERDKEKSILNYIWKSTMSGLLTTVGITNKQQKEAEKNDRKALKNDQKINKEFEKNLKDLDIKKNK